MDETDLSVNPFAGHPPLGIIAFDFTLLEDELRSVLFGRDDWLVPMSPPTSHLSVELGNIDDTRGVEFLFAPYASSIDSSLHCALANWVDYHLAMHDGGFEGALALGLRNILVHGHSTLRQPASTALANMRCIGRFHSGDGGARRIWWGDTAQLDDCACQQVSVGPLHFNAVDYGELIHLDEFMQRKLVSPDREESNKCTLLSVEAVS